MTERLAHAFWITGRAQGEIREHPLTSPTADQLCIETLYSGVSRGTEALVFKGEIPESEYTRMRAPHQSGEFPWPVKYGYANVGKVVEGSRERRGQMVFCLYPHQTHYVINANETVIIPSNVQPDRAILAANMETALNIVWDADVRPGDRVSIIGAGSIGCLTAWLCAQIVGCEVEVMELKGDRQSIVDQLGLPNVTAETASVERDIVINTSASEAGLQRALDLAASEAKVIEASWYGAGKVTLSLGGAFHSKRLQIVSSQVGQVAGTQRARWSHKRRLEKALDLLRDDRLSVLINDESGFSELPTTMQRLAFSPGTTVYHRINYD